MRRDVAYGKMAQWVPSLTGESVGSQPRWSAMWEWVAAIRHVVALVKARTKCPLLAGQHLCCFLPQLPFILYLFYLEVRKCVLLPCNLYWERSVGKKNTQRSQGLAVNELSYLPDPTVQLTWPLVHPNPFSYIRKGGLCLLSSCLTDLPMIR